MTVQNKSCPQCGAQMTFRLGEYQCTSCPHSESAAPAAQPVREEPTIRRTGWQPGSSIPRAAERPRQAEPQAWQAPPPPPPQPGTVFGAGPSGYSDTGYSVAPAYGPPEASDGLKVEKGIFFTILAGVYVLYILAAVFLAIGANTVPSSPGVAGMGGPEEGLGIGVVLGAVIGSGVSLAVAWWVLYGTELWPKYCCMGCNALTLIQAIGSFFVLLGSNSMYDQMGLAPAEQGIANGIAIFLMILQFAWTGWFISILYRDSMRIQGR